MEDEKKVTSLSIALVVIVFIIKIFIAFFTNSLSFLAELSDSIMDFVAVAITFFALRESKKPADNEHMFGHYKINSMAGFIQSLLIIGLYFFILYRSITSMIDFKNYQVNNSLLAAISLVFILGMVFFVSKFIISVGKKTNNQVIIAQGLNFRGDFYRNISVIVGLVFAYFQIFIIDLIVASIFSILSIYEGFKVMKESFNELIDANAVTDDNIEEMKNLIENVSGVIGIDSFAIKTAGNNLDASIGIILHGQQSWTISHIISEQIREIICNSCSKFECNVIIQFHIDSEPIQINYFDKIREVVREDEKEYNLHNIVIDKFEDKLLIQFHIKLNPNLNLTHAHEIVTSIEHKIRDRIFILSKMENIEVISHIEPAERKEKVHKHSSKVEIDDQIYGKAKQLILANLNVQNIRSLEILQEIEELSIITVIDIDPNKTVEEAHIIAEKLEFDLHQSFPNLDHCLIHTEPSNY